MNARGKKSADRGSTTRQEAQPAERPSSLENMHATARNRALARLLAGACPEEPIRRALAARGEQLDPQTRAVMQRQLGRPLGSVRVHRDADAARAAQAANATAFTVGDHVVLGPDAHDLDSARGRQVLAHELTHVQQATGPESLALAPPGSHAEQNAVAGRSGGALTGLARIAEKDLTQLDDMALQSEYDLTLRWVAEHPSGADHEAGVQYLEEIEQTMFGRPGIASTAADISATGGVPTEATPTQAVNVEQLFDQIGNELEIDPATLTGEPDVGANVARAQSEGLIGPQGEPRIADLALQSHSAAPDVREVYGVSGYDVQSAHVGATSFLRDVPGYSRGGAQTALLESATHRAFDNYWKDWAIEQRRLGRTSCSVEELYSVTLDAIDQIPGLPQHTKNTLAWRLEQELYRDLQLQPGDVIDLPYRNIPARASAAATVGESGPVSRPDEAESPVAEPEPAPEQPRPGPAGEFTNEPTTSPEPTELPEVPGSSGPGVVRQTAGPLFSFGAQIVLGSIHQRAKEERIQEQAHERGYVPYGQGYGKGFGGFLDRVGDLIFDPMLSGDSSITRSRIDLPVWQSKMHEWFDGHKQGDTVDFTWESPPDMPLAFPKKEKVTYTLGGDGKWHPDRQGDFPDVNELLAGRLPTEWLTGGLM